MAELKPTEIRVSSVLNKNTREFGKKHLFDGKEDTCWNSDPGRPQWIRLAFADKVTLAAIEVTFQGGFAGKECQLLLVDEEQAQTQVCHTFYPEDSNKLQTFSLPEPRLGQTFIVRFVDSTDFFGRVTVYSLKFLSASP